MHVSRAVEKDLGGGALIDIGIYCLQFVLMVFSGEKPERVQATGFCLDTGTQLKILQAKLRMMMMMMIIDT